MSDKYLSVNDHFSYFRYSLGTENIVAPSSLFPSQTLMFQGEGNRARYQIVSVSPLKQHHFISQQAHAGGAELDGVSIQEVVLNTEPSQQQQYMDSNTIREDFVNNALQAQQVHQYVDTSGKVDFVSKCTVVRNEPSVNSVISPTAGGLSQVVSSVVGVGQAVSSSTDQSPSATFCILFMIREKPSCISLND